MIVLTAENIEMLRTPQGGFNKKTMEIIGAWPLVEGWKDQMIGRRISDRNWQAAMKAKNEKRHVWRGNTRRSRF
jgi:hypothetical protein